MAHTCVPKSLISARLDFGGIINETQQRSRSSNQYTILHIVGAAGPNLPATRTDSDVSQGFFFTGGCHVYPHLDEVPVLTLYLPYGLTIVK